MDGASLPPREPGPLWRDWREAFGRMPLWSALAVEDLRDRYRRTSLGLAWVVLSFAAFVLVKVAIFGQLTTASPAQRSALRRVVEVCVSPGRYRGVRSHVK